MSKNKKSLKFWLIAGIAFVLMIALDQFTKYLAYTNLRGQEDAVWIKNVFVLHYLENQSAAFGKDPVTLLNNALHFTSNATTLLTAKMVFLSLLTIVVVILIAWILRRIPETKRFQPLNVLLVIFCAGAVGNLIDRIAHNYVIDFFYFELINFPVFNVADIYVTCSAILLLILGVFYYKDKDYEQIFPSRKKHEEETPED